MELGAFLNIKYLMNYFVMNYVYLEVINNIDKKLDSNHYFSERLTTDKWSGS